MVVGPSYGIGCILAPGQEHFFCVEVPSFYYPKNIPPIIVKFTQGIIFADRFRKMWLHRSLKIPKGV
jgi:hypothetical protein